jgi:hypothetical protein
MTKRNLLKFHCFGHWNISVFVIVSDFEIRISIFWFIRNLRTSGELTVILRYFLPEPVKEERRQA